MGSWHYLGHHFLQYRLPLVCLCGDDHYLQAKYSASNQSCENGYKYVLDAERNLDGLAPSKPEAWSQFISACLFSAKRPEAFAMTVLKVAFGEALSAEFGGFKNYKFTDSDVVTTVSNIAALNGERFTTFTKLCADVVTTEGRSFQHFSDLWDYIDFPDIQVGGQSGQVAHPYTSQLFVNDLHGFWGKHEYPSGLSTELDSLVERILGQKSEASANKVAKEICYAVSSGTFDDLVRVIQENGVVLQVLRTTVNSRELPDFMAAASRAANEAVASRYALAKQNRPHLTSDFFDSPSGGGYYTSGSSRRSKSNGHYKRFSD